MNDRPIQSRFELLEGPAEPQLMAILMERAAGELSKHATEMEQRDAQCVSHRGEGQRFSEVAAEEYFRGVDQIQLPAAVRRG